MGVDRGGYIGAADGYGMNVGDGSGGERETAVMTGGSDAFVGNRGGNERDCCRFPGFI